MSDEQHRDEQHYKLLDISSSSSSSSSSINNNNNNADIELSSSATRRSGILKEVDRDGGGGGGYLSQQIFSAVRLHHINAAKNEHQSISLSSIARYVVAVLLCVTPVWVFAVMELKHHDAWLFDNMLTFETYLIASSFCGGVGGVFLTIQYDIWEYALSRFLSGFVGSLSSLYTIYLVLQVIPIETSAVAATTATTNNDSTNIIPFGICFFVGSLGAALPSILIYFIGSIISDECWRYSSSPSSLSSHFNDYDNYTVSLITKSKTSPSDEEHNLE